MLRRHKVLVLAVLLISVASVACEPRSSRVGDGVLVDNGWWLGTYYPKYTVTMGSYEVCDTPSSRIHLSNLPAADYSLYVFVASANGESVRTPSYRPDWEFLRDTESTVILTIEFEDSESIQFSGKLVPQWSAGAISEERFFTTDILRDIPMSGAIDIIIQATCQEAADLSPERNLVLQPRLMGGGRKV